MRIIEVFHSIQGEGPLSGVRTSFVRTARCNLRCRWCDTTYSFGPGRERSIPELIRTIERHRTRYVCLTGGEPLLQSESVSFVRELGRRGYTVVVETGGSLDISPYVAMPHVVVSLDVKCPSSGMERHNRWSNLCQLRSTDVAKFVIGDRTDYLYARRTLQRRPMAAIPVFQPVYGTPPGRLADWVLQDRLNVRVMLQEHKILWGDVRGK